MKHKPTFLHQNKPLITCMVEPRSEMQAIDKILTAVYDGADAIGFQMEKMNKSLQTPDVLRRIYAAANGRPLYVTNYRRGNLNEGVTDDELAEGLLMQLEAGATLLDVTGDLYAPDPMELTQDPVAIEKQKKLIDKIHSMGGEVLMSSHVLRYLPPEEVLAVAREQQARGADISKIVTWADTEEEELENLRACTLLRKELDIPFLFLSGGAHNKLHRSVGPALGCCMWLTVPEYDETAAKMQPLCRAIRAIADHLNV